MWQLKEYHIERFLAHFETSQGKKLIFNIVFFSKLLFFIIPIIFSLSYLAKFHGPSCNDCIPFLTSTPASTIVSFIGLFLTYLFEAAWSINNLRQNRIKKPVLTSKVIFLILICYILLIPLFVFIFSNNVYILIIFDLLIPLIVSAIVLLFQPFTALMRNMIIRKAIAKRNKFKKLLVIGITGSYGKTSTKEFLATILSQKFKVLKTKEHRNSEVGVSRTILEELNSKHEVFICEMGAYNRGGIKLLCRIAQPKIGIITGINEQHLSTYGSLDNIVKTKFELIESLPQEGTAILNGDNKLIRTELEHRRFKVKKQKVYSFRDKIDVWSENVVIDRNLVSFKACSSDGDCADFKVSVFGFHNISNLLAAITCAKELGMNMEEIASACYKIEGSQSGMKIIKRFDGLNVIDASYSANPDSVISHLEYLSFWNGQRIIIMPCLIELGSASSRIHVMIGEEIAQVCDLAVITTKDRFKEIKAGAISQGMKKENIVFSENPRQILEKVCKFARPGAVILLESRVPGSVIKRLYG